MPAVQVRDLSPEAHLRLRARAAAAGQSLSEFLRGELERIASVPTPAEISERARLRGAVGGTPAAELIRADRDRHDSTAG